VFCQEERMRQTAATQIYFFPCSAKKMTADVKEKSGGERKGGGYNGGVKGGCPPLTQYYF